ncbi:hypothetical protein SAMN05421820_107384 [Pedobacter steynii]|uniref:DUF3299 domain-containing protein n=1 Tax=Pedobacter steynii TaxID=430522 RepID=A0A1H0BEF2_9SPHI|nr:hypothetical protein [Pedobacter steynii]NQX41081.1 hypothetical protein [Pedobacter steynii]SDN43803.1 hypothetical protein SAMN05421820_107384 [Pedobacter steynii]
MKSRLSLILALLFFTTCALAQKRAHNPADVIRSMNWDVIGSVNFEMDKQNKILPVYGEMIRRFADRDFSLKGYIIPIKAGLKQQQFLLSPLPINQCFFCGQNGVPAMILVNMSSPIAYTTKPVLIEGILKLEVVDAATAAPISLQKATASQAK